MAKWCVILFITIQTISGLTAQTAAADSLRRLFESAREDSTRADLYYQWAYLRLEQDPPSGLASADTLERLAGRKDLHTLSRAAYLRGMAYHEQGKYDLALPFHQRELALALQTDDLELHGKALNSVGNCFHSLGRNDSAIVYLVRSAQVKEKQGNAKDLASAYANIGNVFSDAQAPEKAIEYLEKALALRLSLPDGERSAILTYNNLSVAYNVKGDYEQAIVYAQRGYDLAMKTGQTFLAGVLAGSLGHLWLQKKEIERSIENAERSIELLKQVNRRSNLVYPYATLAEAWVKKGDFAKALTVNQDGYAIMEELALSEPRAVYYENFSVIYEGLGDDAQALRWYKKYAAFNDSLFNKQKIEAIAEIETRYETEKKEAQLARQELELARAAARQKNTLVAALIMLLLLSGGFYLFRHRQLARRREAELAARLEHAEAEKLREMDQLKSAFFANVSHEFRTPLTLIISPAEQLINGDFRGDFQKYLQLILRNARRLLELVNQLLDLSKLESGKMDLRAAKGDLARLVRAVAGSFESLAARQQVELSIDVPDQPLLVYFDRDKVEKILVNLIGNAFKFTGEGGRVEVSLRFADGDERAELLVRDTGIGMPAEQLPHLFERFAHSTSSELQTGSGIGLALTKELVELHGGRIRVDSRENEGTTFAVSLAVGRAFFKEEAIIDPEPGDESASGRQAITAGQIPVENAVASPPPATSISMSAALDQAFMQRPLILLAEDNADVRDYIADTLADRYQVLSRENGALAYEQALETIPDLILTDIMMPDMDGMELCRRLKSHERSCHIPVVMLTARAEQGDRLQGLQTGADDYLIKPFHAPELLARIANLLEQRRQLQAYYRKTLSAFATTPVEADSMDAVFLKNVKAVVENNLDDDQFSVVELGHQLGLSRSQLHRKLSALTGFSPNEVIRNMRLERARQLLEKRSATVSEIAYLCGFSSPAYFIKCFKDFYGIRPGEV